MLVPDEVRKCVAFIGCNTANGMKLFGTAFLTGFDLGDTGRIFTYLVTARHVIDAINEKTVDRKVYVRLNFRDAGARFVETEVSDWRFHPSDSSVDVATMGIGGVPENADHLVYPAKSFATKDIMKD